VAIEIPQPYGGELDRARARFSPDDGDMPAHVTILAPVDVDSDVMEAVIAHLAAVAARTAPFRLILRGSGTFRPVSPVVFVTVAEGISACEQLERQVRSGDLAVETRFPYHPHVTIAHDVPEPDLDRALEELSGFDATMVINTLGLHENVGGRWRLVREFPLGG
jgi:2'-5' RNA ligase